MENLTQDVANLAIQQGLPFMLLGSEGQIFSANDAFCELVGFTEYELKKKGWIDLSVKDEDLLADQATLSNLVAGHALCYTVIKSYVSKSGVPIPGQLYSIRWPQNKQPLEYCLCWFSPLANSSKAALSLVVTYIEKHTSASQAIAEKMGTMAAELELKKAQTVGQRLWDTFGEWALQNPKIAICVLLILLALNPAPIVVAYVTRMGWLPAQPVQIEVKDPETGETSPASKEQAEALVGFSK